MSIFKKKNTDIKEHEGLRATAEPTEALTLFAMANSEPVNMNKVTDKADNYSWSEAFSRLSEQEKREAVIYKEQLSEHFIRHKNKYYLRITDISQTEDDEKDASFDSQETDFLKKIDIQFSEKRVPEKYREVIKQMLCTAGWDYYFLSPLIDNDEIQDIHVYGYNDISVLFRNGVRYDTDISFLDKKDYDNFVSRVAIRNQRGQSNNNAIVKFTDNVSSKKFKLRFDILTKYVTSTGEPYIHIRKHPKDKYSVEDLYKYGAFRDDKVYEFMLNAVKNGESMLLTGKNNSAKTTMLNALIDEISDQKNIFIVEDNEELFSKKRGRIVYTHSVENRLEGKVTYSLSEIAEVSLLCDVDVVIVGEIKNDSAKGLMKAAYVGAQCFSTSHGQSAVDGYYKLADYVKQATGYTLDDCLRFLAGFKNLVYMENKKVAQIAVVDRLDKNRKPVFKDMYDNKKGGWLINEQD